MSKHLLAYQGDIFTIEWYVGPRGKSLALDYYNDLPDPDKEKLLYLFYLLGDTGKIRSKEKFRYEGNQLYAFKLAPYRFLCFFYTGSKVIVTNAYKKQTDKMPVKEKQKALQAKDDYSKRCKRGNYYE